MVWVSLLPLLSFASCYGDRCYLVCLVLALINGSAATAEIFVDVIRGIPLMILAAFIFWGIPNLIESVTGHQSPINDFCRGTIALSLNAAAYIAEIVRGDPSCSDWTDGSQPKPWDLLWKTMRKIILPQATKLVLQTLLTNSSLP